MPVVRDDEQDRLARIEALVKKLQGELSALREESRVVAEQMVSNAVDSAKLRRTAALTAKARATIRRERTNKTIERKRR